jgi:hypothetical protein
MGGAVTDTRVLDSMMRMLQRNPLAGTSADQPPAEFHITDERPFWSRNEPIAKRDMNRRYAERVDLFHQDLTVPRQEKPRKGSCNACGGVVHAVETRIQGAVRVDGRCLSCGADYHRAGVLPTD